MWSLAAKINLQLLFISCILTIVPDTVGLAHFLQLYQIAYSRSSSFLPFFNSDSIMLIKTHAQRKILTSIQGVRCRYLVFFICVCSLLYFILLHYSGFSDNELTFPSHKFVLTKSGEVDI